MKLKSYLVFNGNTKEVLNFYAKVFNGTKSGWTFAEIP